MLAGLVGFVGFFGRISRRFRVYWVWGCVEKGADCLLSWLMCLTCLITQNPDLTAPGRIKLNQRDVLMQRDWCSTAASSGSGFPAGAESLASVKYTIRLGIPVSMQVPVMLMTQSLKR